MQMDTANSVRHSWLALALLTVLGTSGVAAGDPPVIPMRDFFRNPEQIQFQLSPNGEYVAFLKPWQTRLNVHVQRIGDDEVTRVTSATERDIYGFTWKGNDRILYVQDQGGDENFRLYAVGIDGTSPKDLTPFEKTQTRFVDELEDNDTEILISLNKRDPRIFDVYRVNVDTGEKCIIARNLFGAIRTHHAVSCNLVQAGRIVGGRTGLCREHSVMNSVFVNCPKRIMFSRAETNAADGNLYDARNAATSFCIELPAPQVLLDLAAWQEHYGLDANSRQAIIDAEFDPETLELTLTIEGEIPKCAPEGLPRGVIAEDAATPGPFDLKLGKQVIRLGAALER